MPRIDGALIATASVEQSGGISQVNQAAAQMDQIIQQNAALVEQAAATSLAEQAVGLSQALSVSKFNRPVSKHRLVETPPAGMRLQPTLNSMARAAGAKNKALPGRS